MQIDLNQALDTACQLIGRLTLEKELLSQRAVFLPDEDPQGEADGEES